MLTRRDTKAHRLTLYVPIHLAVPTKQREGVQATLADIISPEAFDGSLDLSQGTLTWYGAAVEALARLLAARLQLESQ